MAFSAAFPLDQRDTSPNQASIYSERAISMIRSLGIAPTPKHYAVFFACAAGQPTELVSEVEHTVNAKETFSDELLDRLYNTYIAQPQTKLVQDTAAQTKRILSDMTHNVSQFTGTTRAVSNEVAQQLRGLDSEASEENIRSLANSLVEGAQTIQQSGDQMSARLAEAQKEIVSLRENLARAMTEADRDFLTGCFNRKAFDKHLADTIEHSRAGEGELTLLMLDIDHFKKFNDSFGHLVGDEVLKIVAKTLTDMVKGKDIVARFGGEEFAVILPNTPVGGAMIVANTIRKSVAARELRRKTTGESFGNVTVSIGVACLRAGDTPERFVERADEALYRSKKSGRNCVTQENLAA
jgi:diguanylate cyclase